MSRPPRPGGVRVSRVVIAAFLAGAVVAAGVALERVGPRSLAAREVPEDISGAWFCPHGGGEGWRSWVVVANATSASADLRVVTFGSKRPTRQVVRVPAGAQSYVEVEADQPGSATSVEYFGGPVVGGMVVTRPGGKGMGAEPCAPTSSRRWILTEATTVRGFTERLIVMNPFAERAVFDVVLTTEDDLLRPGDLTGVVLGARRSISFDLGRFALEKGTLVATVQVDLGKVIAGGLGISERGVRLTLPATEAAARWALPGAGVVEGGALTVTSPSASSAPFRVRAQTGGRQTEIVADAEAPAFRGASLQVDLADAALLVAADGPTPLVAQRRLVMATEQASTAGSPGGAARWVALPAMTPEGGTASLLLQNPEDEVAEVRLRLLTLDGPAEAPSIARIVLPPGRLRILPLGDLVGTQPVSVLVEADIGTVVAAQIATSGAGFALSVGGRIPG